MLDTVGGLIMLLLLLALAFLIIWYYYAANNLSLNYHMDVRPKSYDLFDTLGARRYGSDDRNFELVGQKLDLPHFARDRRSVNGSTLEEIYDKLAALGYSRDIMAEEIQMELDNMVPIKSHITMIESNELIITDTYYDIATIRKILAKLEVPEDVQLVVTPDGKYTQSVWPTVANQTHHHIGDNTVTDGSAARHGILTTIHDVNVLTPIEQKVNRIWNNMGYFMRECRLACPHLKDTSKEIIWRGHSEYNVPLLILFAHFLHQWCQEHQIVNVRCMLRDGCLFSQLFNRLYGDIYDVKTIYASRHALTHPTAKTIRYLNDNAQPADQTVWIDGHGTGKSLYTFFNDNNLTMPYNVNIYRFWTPQKLPRSARKYVEKDFYHYLTHIRSAVNPTTVPKFDQLLDDTWCDFIEIFNSDTQGSFINYRSDGQPMFKRLEYPVEFADEFRQAFNTMVDIYFKNYVHQHTDINYPEVARIINDHAIGEDAYWQLRNRYHVP